MGSSSRHGHSPRGSLSGTFVSMSLGLTPSAASATSATNIATYIVAGVLLISSLALLIQTRAARRKELAENEDEISIRPPSARSSLQTLVLPLFGLTLVFSILAFTGSVVASDSTSAHLTAVDLFTEFAGAGALLSGVATMLAVWISYLDRQRKEKRSADTDVMNHVIEHMNRSLTSDDIRALGDLARALNGGQDTSHKNNPRAIEPPPENMDKSS